MPKLWLSNLVSEKEKITSAFLASNGAAKFCRLNLMLEPSWRRPEICRPFEVMVDWNTLKNLDAVSRSEDCSRPIMVPRNLHGAMLAGPWPRCKSLLGWLCRFILGARARICVGSCSARQGGNAQARSELCSLNQWSQS